MLPLSFSVNFSMCYFTPLIISSSRVTSVILISPSPFRSAAFSSKFAAGMSLKAKYVLSSCRGIYKRLYIKITRSKKMIISNPVIPKDRLLL